jgi:hypothetical protein
LGDQGVDAGLDKVLEVDGADEVPEQIPEKEIKNATPPCTLAIYERSLTDQVQKRLKRRYNPKVIACFFFFFLGVVDGKY